MEVVIERACGMDVHKDNITACIMTPEGKEIQTFSTKTVFLIQLVDWIKKNSCTHVAMESTSVYWKPIVNFYPQFLEILIITNSCPVIRFNPSLFSTN
ncbi:transposase [Peribacillus frigoritolerans]|uniref:IS110 family transposase n=1 Tax=Peribacillus frigoritolerans TaxID=450367 RepID=UPI000ABCC9F9